MVAQPRVARRPSQPVVRVSVALFTAGLCTAIVTGQSVATGTIAGHVRVVAKSSHRLIAAGAYPGRVVGASADHDPSELPNVIVFVKARPTPSAPQRARIRQSHEAFVPHVTVVTAGSTIDFPNEDLIFHNVFSLSRAAEFDLGRYPQGTSKSRVFNRPGTVKVYCQLHSHMSALIRVFDHPYFAVPDALGRFAIPSVPAGKYDVVAWHERAGEVTTSAVVTAGETSEISVSLPLTDSK
jgi:plastocyanin